MFRLGEKNVSDTHICSPSAGRGVNMTAAIHAARAPMTIPNLRTGTIGVTVPFFISSPLLCDRRSAYRAVEKRQETRVGNATLPLNGSRCHRGRRGRLFLVRLTR